MKEEIKIILDLIEKILTKYIDHYLRLNPENKLFELNSLKDQIFNNELSKLLVKQNLGGAGFSLEEVIPIIQLTAKYGIPLPFVETLIANFLLSEVGYKTKNELITICHCKSNSKIISNNLSGEFNSIPYLNITDKILAKINIHNDNYLVFFKIKKGLSKRIKNFNAEPRFNLSVKKGEIIYMNLLPKKINFEYLLTNIKSIQSFGTMEKILQLSIDYSCNRKQFGRALSKFQMIQSYISEIALEVAATGASLSTLKIRDKTNNVDINNCFYSLENTAIPKIRTGIASGKISALSHQIHGAMGFTREYQLSYFTKILNSWRNDFGSEIYWQTILGKYFLKQNKSLWSFLNT